MKAQLYAGICLIAVSAPAIAQNNQQPSTSDQVVATDDSGEIIVTAQRRAESLQDVPVSVSVATGENLRQQNIRTFEDLSARVPNLRMVAATLSDQIHVRGTGSGFNTGFEQSVATFVDGVYRSRSRASRVAIFDIDRVEVLKGPQTIFFGANAIAGALNITTRKPDRAFGVNGSALYAPADGEYNIEAGISAPISDTLAVRLSGRWSGMDGYIVSARDGSKGPHLNNKQGRLSAIWEPANNIEIAARYDIARLRDKGTFLAELFSCPPATRLPAGQCARALTIDPNLDSRFDYRSGASFGGGLDLNLDEGVVNTKVDLGGVVLNSLTSYQRQRADARFEVSPFPVASPIGTPSYNPVFSGELYRQFSQELRLESDAGERFNYIVGGYFERGKLDNVTVQGNFNIPVALAAQTTYPANTPIAIFTRVGQRSHTYSAFGSATYEIIDGLQVTGSLRYTNVEKAAERFVEIGSVPAFVSPDVFVPGPASVQAILAAQRGADLRPYAISKRRDDEFMPAANLKYKINDDVLIYASYAHGFKAGGFSGGTSDVFNPETVNSYEAGIKAQWLDRKLTTNISLFRSNYQNLQEAQNVILPSGAALQVVTNAAQSRAQGIEFSTVMRPSSSLTFRADIAYLDSKYIRYPDAPCSPLEAIGVPNCRRDRSGLRRAYSPNWSGSVSLDYSTKIGSEMQLRLGSTVYFTGSYFQQPAISELVEEDGYAKLDLRAALSIKNGQLEFAVIGKNVTDKLTVGYRNYSPAAVGTAYGIPDRPRSVAFQLTAKY
jgi:iron complex outermembrane recepter protein